MCELIALSARTPRSLCDSMMKAVVKQYNSECYNSVQNTISCKFNEVLLQKLNNSIELQLFIIHVRQMWSNVIHDWAWVSGAELSGNKTNQID